MYTRLLQVDLLEDLHSGSGLGEGAVDRLLARDSAGQIVVPHSHLKGVMRDNALRLAALGHREVTPQNLDALFGIAGSQRGALIVGTLRAQANLRPLIWNRSARKAGQRAPDEHSLHSGEYMPATTRLTGKLWLFNGALRDAVDAILRFTDRLGGERSRGSGQLKIAKSSWQAPALATASAKSTDSSSVISPVASTCMQIVLHCDEPVCIPVTGEPGNIIPGASYVPGPAFFGALAAASMTSGQRPDSLFEQRLSIGSAYPLPVTTDVLRLPTDVVCLPLPEHLRYRKFTPPVVGSWPHWATPLPATEWLDCTSSSVKTKRGGEHDYLTRLDGKWAVHRVALEMRLRNRRGQPLGDTDKSNTELFSVESIPAGTLLLSEVRGTAKDIASLGKQLKHLLHSGWPLRVGRGGSPVSIALVRDTTIDSTDLQARTLVLESDLIQRDENLNFHCEPVAALHALAEINMPIPAYTFSTSTVVERFNAATGLPAAPKMAIRRGAVLSFCDGADLSDLKHALHRAKAEDHHLGYGRIRWLNICFSASDDSDSDKQSLGSPESTNVPDEESIVRQVFEADGASLPAQPSRSQLGRLRGWIGTLPDTLLVAELTRKLQLWVDLANDDKLKHLINYLKENLQQLFGHSPQSQHLLLYLLALEDHHSQQAQSRSVSEIASRKQTNDHR